MNKLIRISKSEFQLEIQNNLINMAINLQKQDLFQS